MFDSASGAEQTDIAVVDGFTVKSVACDTGDPIDLIEFVTTGGTSLRYDTTAGQFIQNWKTPKTAGCYKATMTTTDASSLMAYFKVK